MSFCRIFFKKIDLVKDENFVSGEASKRAVLILQYVADGLLEFPEYELPLNKIMCGVDIREPVERFLEPTGKEDSECKALLKKVMERSPRLKGFDTDEFRDVFLKRKGALSIRDRTWLLRVESEGRDLLLHESFSAAGFLALPWMRDPVFVEWL